MDWSGVASASALAAVACVLTCIVAAKTGSDSGSGDSPAFGSAEADLLVDRAPYPSHDPPSD